MNLADLHEVAEVATISPLNSLILKTLTDLSFDPGIMEPIEDTSVVMPYTKETLASSKSICQYNREREIAGLKKSLDATEIKSFLAKRQAIQAASAGQGTLSYNDRMQSMIELIKDCTSK